jgi:hypothetical protein
VSWWFAFGSGACVGEAARGKLTSASRFGGAFVANGGGGGAKS